MLFFINKKSKYHDKLQESDSEFEFKENRPYLVVYGIKLNGKKGNWAIPARSNIPRITQKEGLYLQCPDTNETKPEKGNVAGFDFTKAIPFSEDLFDELENKPSKQLVEIINIAQQNFPFIKQTMQKMFNDIERGKKPAYAINTDNAIKVRDECEAYMQGQIQKPKTNTVRQLNRLNKILPTNKSNKPQTHQSTYTRPLDKTTQNLKEDKPIDIDKKDKTADFKEFAKADTRAEQIDHAQNLLNNTKFLKYVRSIQNDKWDAISKSNSRDRSDNNNNNKTSNKDNTNTSRNNSKDTD